MTNEQILLAAIKKALTNNEKLFLMLNIIPEDCDREDNKYESDTFSNGWIIIDTREFCVNDIIFNRDFAKAFWGEDFLWTGVDNGYHKGSLGRCLGICWQYHLQQMVISEDPIKYLEQYL